MSGGRIASSLWLLSRKMRLRIPSWLPLSDPSSIPAATARRAERRAERRRDETAALGGKKSVMDPSMRWQVVVWKGSRTVYTSHSTFGGEANVQ